MDLSLVYADESSVRSWLTCTWNHQVTRAARVKLGIVRDLERRDGADFHLILI
jgi:hypothetical protein